MAEVKMKTDAAPTSRLRELMAEGDFVKVPKIAELVTGVVIDISKSEVRLDIDGLATGVVRGREYYDAAEEYRRLKVGDSVEATVIDLENENGEIELSFRYASRQKAWTSLADLMRSGNILSVDIIDANKGGLLVRLDRVAGFLPVSQLQPEHYPRVPGGDKAKIFERLKSYVGQKFEVKVIDVDEAEDKLIVSEKAAWEERQQEVISSYKVGDVVEGRVTAVTDFGAFVEFGENSFEGLVHISELAWQRIDNPADVVKVGDQIKAEIIKVEGSRIFLSMKKLKQDPWAHVAERYKIGQVVKGKVLKIIPFGLFIELDPEIHGLAHISELADHPVQDASVIAKPGDELDFMILTIEPDSHRLGLSRKALQQPKEAASPAAPAAEAAPIAPPTES